MAPVDRAELLHDRSCRTMRSTRRSLAGSRPHRKTWPLSLPSICLASNKPFGSGLACICLSSKIMSTIWHHVAERNKQMLDTPSGRNRNDSLRLTAPSSSPGQPTNVVDPTPRDFISSSPRPALSIRFLSALSFSLLFSSPDPPPRSSPIFFSN